MLDKKEKEREELDKAMSAFLEKGGKIKVLPPVKTRGDRSSVRHSRTDPFSVHLENESQSLFGGLDTYGTD